MRALAAVLLLLPSLASAAAATWSAATSASCSLNGTYSASNCRSRKAVCGTGSCDAPTLATEGIFLDQVGSVSVVACADDGATISDGDGFLVYFYDATTALWAKLDLTLTVPTGARCGYARGDSPGLGIPILSKRGRLAVVPSGAGASAGGITVYVLAVGPQGQDL